MDATDVPVASLDDYFTKEALMEMPEIDKKRYGNILRNYQEMKKLGLDPVPPNFICKSAALVEINGNLQGRGRGTRRSKPISYRDEDDDWCPSMEVEGRRYKLRRNSRTLNKPTFYNLTPLDRGKAGTSVQVSLPYSPVLKCPKNNQRYSAKKKFKKLSSSSCEMVSGAVQENATLSAGQRESVHLWRTAKLELVSKKCVKVVPLPQAISPLDTEKSQEVLHSVCSGKENTIPGTRKNPRRKASLILSYKEMDVCEDDFIYCDECSEEREGECPLHPLYLILDEVVVRDGSVKDRAKKTAPWPLSICESKIKGAGLGVWTNESLPGNLIFGPYEGHILSNVEPGKESGYGWVLRWAGSTNACVDALDESVSNWMRYVNCSRNESETNVGAFQYKGQIYYKTLKEINRGTELMVWYGDEYGKELGLSRDEILWKLKPKDSKGREHGWCADLSSCQNLHSMKRCQSNKIYKRFNGNENVNYENSKIAQTESRYSDENVEVDIFQSPPADHSLLDINGKLCQPESKEMSSLIFIPQEKEEKFSNIFLSRREDSTVLGETSAEHGNFKNTFSEPCEYILSEKSLAPKDKLPFKCKDCGQICSRRDDLNKHMRIHTGEKPFECKDCCKRFTQISNLNGHMRIHTGEKPFESKDCGKRFSEISILNRHMRIHTGEKPFEYKDCGKRFNVRSTLNTHMRIHTGEKPFECKDCCKRFTQISNLNKHMRIHTGEKPFECKDCGKRFNQRIDLNNHMRIHTGEKPFECKDCGKRFSERGYLDKHMRIHKCEKPFECKDCGKRFTRRSNLNTHMRIHTGEKPFECKDCGKRFSRRGSLKIHMRIHTGEKPFECKDCGKRCTLRGDLDKHMRIHTGEKPFECKDCGKRFTVRSHLNRHMRIHTREKRFECKDCGKRFNQRTNMNNHMRIHTGEKPFEC